jgi:hypothetical protein
MKSVKAQKVLSRKKRYLSFPEGSSAVVSDLSDHKFELSASNEEYTEKISY